MRKRNGQFAKTLPIWTKKSWGKGWVDSRGYFRVYRPDYPRAWPSGYAKRYHIVWWLSTGRVIPHGYVLHHKNENTLDDRLSNLELLEHGEHTRLHFKLPDIVRTCKYCKKTFILSRSKNCEGRGKFCGQECFHKNKRDFPYCRRGHPWKRDQFGKTKQCLTCIRERVRRLALTPEWRKRRNLYNQKYRRKR